MKKPNLFYLAMFHYNQFAKNKKNVAKNLNLCFYFIPLWFEMQGNRYTFIEIVSKSPSIHLAFIYLPFHNRNTWNLHTVFNVHSKSSPEIL